MPNNLPIDPAILHYYNLGREDARLQTGANRLEWLRTQELLRRFLPPAPAVIADIGGGSGPYAFWLAAQGYTVHLVDLVPLHIEQALLRAAASGVELASYTVGDARHVNLPDASMDAMLLLGPLYHLTEAEDRQAALREAQRITRPGGVICAAAISRFASALGGLHSGFLDDPTFQDIVREDIANGQHRNPKIQERYFTTTYFHHPTEMDAELRVAGWEDAQNFAIEGPGWLTLGLLERLDDAEARAPYLAVIRALEQEPSLLGVSNHLLAVGCKS